MRRPLSAALISLRRLVATHWAVSLVLALSLVVRSGVAIAYRPAIFFGDSWVYLDLAYNGTPVGIAPDRPSGYPLVIDVLSAGGRSLAAITTAQHIAGLVTGLLVYALLLRLGVPRLLSAGAAAVVLLDGYAIALEQQILAEAFFTLALVGSVYLAAGRDRGPTALAASGGLLAAATMMRTVAVFALPVWVCYVFIARGIRSRSTTLALVGLLLPLLAYSGWHATTTGRLGLMQADGWFLYGRVGQIADCGGATVPAEARPLCGRTARDRREGAAFHVWNADGPARRVFAGMSRNPDRQGRSNRILREFALAIIRARPGRYAHVVTTDFLRYFRPGVMSRGNSDLALLLPERSRLVRRNEQIRDRYFPGYTPKIHAPAKLMRGYQDRLHTPRWLLAFSAALSLAALALALSVRWRLALSRRREVFLLSGLALAMLLGSAGTSEFVLRYLIPTVPLLVCSGVTAGMDLAAVAQRVVFARLRARRALYARA